MTRDVAGPREAAVAALAEALHDDICQHSPGVKCVGQANTIADYLDANPTAKAELARWLGVARGIDVTKITQDAFEAGRNYAATELSAGVTSEAGLTREDLYAAQKVDVGNYDAAQGAIRILTWLHERLEPATPSTSTETPTRVVGGGETEDLPAERVIRRIKEALTADSARVKIDYHRAMLAVERVEAALLRDDKEAGGE